jgi:hypothetical protein
MVVFTACTVNYKVCTVVLIFCSVISSCITEFTSS